MSAFISINIPRCDCGFERVMVRVPPDNATWRTTVITKVSYNDEELLITYCCLLCRTTKTRRVVLNRSTGASA